MGRVLDDIAAAAIDDLGGSDDAAAKLGLYLRMPTSWAPHRQCAIDLLGHCGAAGVPRLARQIRDDDERLQNAAWRALTSYAALGTLDRLCDDQDSRVRERAISALTETLFPDVRSFVVEVRGAVVVMGAGTGSGLRPGQELMIFRKEARLAEGPIGIVGCRESTTSTRGPAPTHGESDQPGDQTMMKQPDLEEVRRVARRFLARKGELSMRRPAPKLCGSMEAPSKGDPRCSERPERRSRRK